jgi:type VI secretion system protein ImpL
MNARGLGRPGMLVWVVTGLAYLIYAVLVWFLGNWLALHGSTLWLLRIGLWVFGLVAAAVVLWFVADAASPAPGATGLAEEIETILDAAESRLAAAQKSRWHALRRMPLTVVLGPEGATKTSAVVHSGLDPDLLAGEVFQQHQITSTPAANIWYSHRALLLEIGGRVASAPELGRLIRRIRPQVLMPMLTGRPQAPRAAILCFPCDELLKPGALETLQAAAREQHAQLARLARAFGVQLPVYVLFTKADRIPHFAAFAARLSREECQQVLGVTLRWPSPASAGLYGDRESQRLQVAFDRLLGALAEKRIDLLSREPNVEEKAGIYEFPRELRKLVPALSRFLVDLCRPSQIAVSPVLRGVYFAGVRAVVVRDAAPVESARVLPGHVAATQVFGAGLEETPPTAAQPTARKLPEWLFLGTLLRDVVQRDRAPVAVARSARRVSLWRRVALGAVAVLSLIAMIWSGTAFAKNRQALAVTRSLGTVVPSATELPSRAALAQLDALGKHLNRLSTWGRLGLYKGTGLYPDLRQVYLTRFEQLLLGPARAALVRSLDRLPETPTAQDQYGSAFDVLKAYLMTTNYPDNMEAGFLTPMLLRAWTDGRQVGPEQSELARAQFDFYATHLCRGHRCGSDGDPAVVARTRAFLHKFSGADRKYQLIVSAANAHSARASFALRFPGAVSYVSDAYEVPGAFTPQGWAFVQAELQRGDQASQAEDWVLGAEEQPQTEPVQAADLHARYVKDYIAQWQAVLAAASVVRFGGATDAARRLETLSGNMSPLLQLLSFIANNTNVDSASVGAAFQPVSVVTPPGDEQHFVGASNQSYVTALASLQQALQQASVQGGGMALAPIPDPGGAARVAVQQLALKFWVNGAARDVGARVQALLEAPIVSVEGILKGQPAANLNASGASFCRNSFDVLMTKYPFNRNASSDATVAEVSNFFEPGDGALWQFYNQTLQAVMEKQGNQYVAKARTPVTARGEFVRFFNRLAAVTDALWPPGSREPRFDYTIKLEPTGIDAASFGMDGRRARFTPTIGQAQPYTWVGTPGEHEAHVSVEVQGSERQLYSYPGTWGLFRLLQRATWRTSGSPGVIQWVGPAGPGGPTVTLQAQINLGAAQALLKGDYFVGMRCVDRIVQ